MVVKLKKSARPASKSKGKPASAAKKKSSGVKKTAGKPSAKKTTQVKSKPSDREKVKPAAENNVISAPLVQSKVDKKKSSTNSKTALFGIIIVAVIILLYFLMPDLKKMFSKKDEVKEKIPEADANIPDNNISDANIVDRNTADTNTARSEIQTGTSAPAENKNYREYKIRYKDQLTSISKEFYGNYADWKKIYAANKDIIKDPNLIFPGHIIKIPDLEK